MIVDVAGVLEDGAPRSPNLPAGNASAISFPRGSTVSVRLRVTTPTGAPVDLGGGSLTLTVKKNALQDRPDLIVAGVVAVALGKGYATFAIAPAGTRRLLPGRYAWDAWFVDGASNRNAVVTASELVLTPSVTTVP